MTATRQEGAQHVKQDSLPHFRCQSETRIGQYVPSTCAGLIAEVDEKIHKGEILRPPQRLTESGKFPTLYFNVFHGFVINQKILVIRYRGRGHVQIIARYCLDYHLDGRICETEIYRLINDCQAAHYIEHINEGNSVEHNGSPSVPSHPRASSLELLEKRLKTVEEDPNHILHKRMKISGRRFKFLGNKFL